MFPKKKPIPQVPQQPFPQGPQQPKEKKEECDIRIRRDKEGKIIGLRRRGKCTKEDMLAFAREHNLNLDKLEE